MARGRNRRDPHEIANVDTLSDLLGPPDVPSLPAISVEDRRRETVEVSPIPRTWVGRPSRIVPAPVARTFRNTRSRSKAHNQMAFEVPRDVLVCVRRKARKEVLLAKGKGGGRHKPGKRGPWSSTHCRRK